MRQWLGLYPLYLALDFSSATPVPGLGLCLQFHDEGFQVPRTDPDLLSFSSLFLSSYTIHLSSPPDYMPCGLETLALDIKITAKQPSRNLQLLTSSHNCTTSNPGSKDMTPRGSNFLAYPSLIWKGNELGF